MRQTLLVRRVLIIYVLIDLIIEGLRKIKWSNPKLNIGNSLNCTETLYFTNFKDCSFKGLIKDFGVTPLW